MYVCTDGWMDDGILGMVAIIMMMIMIHDDIPP